MEWKCGGRWWNDIIEIKNIIQKPHSFTQFMQTLVNVLLQNTNKILHKFLKGSCVRPSPAVDLPTMDVMIQVGLVVHGWWLSSSTLPTASRAVVSFSVWGCTWPAHASRPRRQIGWWHQPPVGSRESAPAGEAPWKFCLFDARRAIQKLKFQYSSD